MQGFCISTGETEEQFSFALSHFLNLLICIYDHKYRDHSAGQAFSRILWCRDSLGKIHPVVLVGKYNRNKN